MTVKEVAKFVRSKNAGPFWITIDLFAETIENYLILKNSSQMNQKVLADVLEADPDSIKIFFLDDLRVIKISVPRQQPQGFRYERDMHAGQQYLPLLDLKL